MSDNGKKEFIPDITPAEKEEPKDFLVTITLKKDGKIEVTAPLHNEPMCLFALEKAKDIIKDYNTVKVSQPLISPQGISIKDKLGMVDLRKRWKI
jgi:hypothetical protein